MFKSEFEEIGHCGGQVIFHIKTNSAGHRGYSVSWQHSRPVAAALFAVYAIPQGIPVSTIKLGGIGQPWDPPPIPGCFPVFIASDSEGKFGYQCPDCDGYWRALGAVFMCPYCATRADRHHFLTIAQKSFVQQYCRRLAEALEGNEDGDYTIDMDAVADAVGKDATKPAFYYARRASRTSSRAKHVGSSMTF